VSAPLLIVNPRSGGGKTGATFDDLRRTIEAALGTVDVAMTERPGHGIELARAAAQEGRELVVAVGGDGTLNEVVGGVVGAERKGTEVGLVAQGTGGDFRRTLGVEHRLKDYLDALGSGRKRQVDVGRARFRANDGSQAERYFVNILSAGTSGLVDRYVADASRALGGTAAYFFASLKALARSRPGRLRIASRSDGKTEERHSTPFLIAICNGQFFGAGMQVAPMAKIDDGRFDVVLMSAPSKLAYAMTGRKMYSGGHLSRPGVEHFACDRIELDLEGDEARDVFLLDVDGEPLGGLPLEVELLPGALTLRA
jgi:diacylglycerol kinase (ATP)